MIVVLGALVVAGVALGVVGALDQDAGEGAAPVPTDASETTSDVATSASVTDAPETTSDVATSVAMTVPYFRATAGWEAVQEGSAVAAGNVPLGNDALEVFPAGEAVGRLEDGDVVLKASYWRGTAADATFPPRELPLSLDDAQPGGIEGSPDNVYIERLLANVNGWNIDLLIFFGGTDPTAASPFHTDPSPETRAAAQEQLARLVVPSD